MDQRIHILICASLAITGLGIMGTTLSKAHTSKLATFMMYIGVVMFVISISVAIFVSKISSHYNITIHYAEGYDIRQETFYNVSKYDCLNHEISFVDEDGHTHIIGNYDSIDIQQIHEK